MNRDGFCSVEEAIEELRDGQMIIVVDDEARENEGDLVIAADKVDAEKINFMARHARGLICVPMTGERLDELMIPDMVESDENTSAHETAFAVSVGARELITTGISASDRAATIGHLVNEESRPEDFCRPGHVFPLRARPGGVLQRAGHTETAVDLARMAGMSPAGVICEIMNEDGSMARLPELQRFAADFGMKILTVAELIGYRARKDKLVRRVGEVKLPSRYGRFRAVGFESLIDGHQHVALVKGQVEGVRDVLVRVHSECLTGDVFHSLRCDCGSQMETALEMIEEEGTGVFLYILGHEGRGIGLLNKLKAYELQENGLDTVQANKKLGFPADLREYGIGAQILVDLGITSMRLLTNNPFKIVGVQGYGLEVTGRVPIEVEPNPENVEYLKAKKDKLSHFIGDVGQDFVTEREGGS